MSVKQTTVHMVAQFQLTDIIAKETYRLQNTNELAHDKTYNKTCETSKDSDQPVHLLSLAKVLIYLSLDSLEV